MPASRAGLGAADATTKTRRGEQGRASHRAPHCPATRRDVPTHFVRAVLLYALLFGQCCHEIRIFYDLQTC